MAKIEPVVFILRDESEILVREAEVQDASAVLKHVHCISGESDYLTIGPGEFELTVEQEAAYLKDSKQAENKLYIIAMLGSAIVGALSFSASSRPRTRHSGEIAMSVRKTFWGKGIGSALLDVLIDWSNENQIVTKLNLRVRTDNQAAITLYKKKGFVEEGLIHKAIFLNGRYYDFFWMGLET
ncbi:MAG: GNAT family N-acetyltransferase [Candidatus Promineifilaceae bacterium]